MKYKKIDISEKFLGEGFFTYDWQETDSRIDWYVKSEHKEVRCPVCNAMTSSVHSTYKRRIQGVPMKGKHTVIHLVANKYDCTNESCSNKVIVEPLDFASWKQRRTIDLDCLILAVSCFISDEGASKILKTIGVDISNDSIYRLRKKLEFVDDPDIEAVGIDDVAIRKGQSYATAIYDMDDHHMIALLEGRDKETLKGWLSDRYNVSMVNSAANAIAFLATNKPDLILLDYEMPVCSGPQLLEMIRAESGTSSIPVIFLTSKDDRESVAKVLALKPQGYLLKTLNPDQIVSSIDEFFQLEKAKQQ